MKREPAGTSKGGQFAATGRDEVPMDILDEYAEAYNRLCPLVDEDGCGAYFDQHDTPEELRDKLREAFDEAQSLGVIRSDMRVIIDIDPDDIEPHITIVHPNEGVNQFYMTTFGRNTLDYTEDFAETMDRCKRIRDSYALTYEEFGNMRYHNWAELEFYTEAGLAHQARQQLCPPEGTYFDPLDNPRRLRSRLQKAFESAQFSRLIREDLDVEISEDGEDVYITVSGMTRDDAYTTYRDKDGNLQEGFSREYEDTLQICKEIRDSFAQDHWNKAELDMGVE